MAAFPPRRDDAVAFPRGGGRIATAGRCYRHGAVMPSPAYNIIMYAREVLYDPLRASFFTFLRVLLKIVAEKFGGLVKSPYLCTRKREGSLPERGSKGLTRLLRARKRVL